MIRYSELLKKLYAQEWSEDFYIIKDWSDDHKDTEVKHESKMVPKRLPRRRE